MSAIPTLGKPTQGNGQFVVSFGYIVRPCKCLKNEKRKKGPSGPSAPSLEEARQGFYHSTTSPVPQERTPWECSIVDPCSNPLTGGSHASLLPLNHVVQNGPFPCSSDMPGCLVRRPPISLKNGPHTVLDPVYPGLALLVGSILPS